MTQNPYESKKARRSRIVSNIVIVFFIVTFFWGLYHVFIGTQSKIVPFEFTEVTAQVVEDNRNDEFDELFNYVLTMDEDTVKDEKFAENFPIASALLDMEKCPFGRNAIFLHRFQPPCPCQNCAERNGRLSRA